PGTPPATGQRAFWPCSMFTAILPNIDQQVIYDGWDFNSHYSSGINAPLAFTNIPSYRCPSNNVTLADPAGFGIGDYMPIAYTDIDPGTGQRNKAYTNDSPGMLGFTRKVNEVADGLSNTMCVIEDANRPSATSGTYDQTAKYLNGPYNALGGMPNMN